MIFRLTWIFKRKNWKDSNASKSNFVTLLCMELHVIPSQLQKWVELFQDGKTPQGSLDMDSLNLSSANWLVAWCKHNHVCAKPQRLQCKDRNEVDKYKTECMKHERKILLFDEESEVARWLYIYP